MYIKLMEYKYKYKKYKTKYLKLKSEQFGSSIKHFIVKNGIKYIKNKIIKKLILKCNKITIDIYDQLIINISKLFNNFKSIFIKKIDIFLKNKYPNIIINIDDEINNIYDNEIKNMIDNFKKENIKKLCSFITVFIIDFISEFIIIIYENLDNDDKNIDTVKIYSDVNKLLTDKYKYLTLNILNFQSIIIDYVKTSIITKIKHKLNIKDDINFTIDQNIIDDLKNKNLNEFIIAITNDETINNIYQSLKSNLKDEKDLPSEIKISDIIDKRIISAIQNILTNDKINFKEIMNLIKENIQ